MLMDVDGHDGPKGGKEREKDIVKIIG